MRVITKINGELTEILEPYRQWIYRPAVQGSMQARMASAKPRFKLQGRPEDSCSVETLMSLNHAGHEGFPNDFHGIDLNYKNVQNESAQFDPGFFAEVRVVNNGLDDQLQSFLGAKSCALKAFYPADGYITWHTNWNVPGYVIIFTHSQNGNGYWRHIDATAASSIKPNPNQLVQINDVAGWHCKAGYFGGMDDYEKIVWHCAYSTEPRITLSYLIPDKAIWEDILAEVDGR